MRKTGADQKVKSHASDLQGGRDHSVRLHDNTSGA